MAYKLEAFSEIGLDESLLGVLLGEHERGRVPTLRRLWLYYRNPEESRAGISGWDGRRRLAQEMGLPARLTGAPRDETAIDDRDMGRKEIVIENDIGWRVHAMVDFMFGKPIQVLSTARDEDKRKTIGRVLDAVWEASGGVGLLQDIALLGHVYGYVDVMVRVDERGLGLLSGRTLDDVDFETIAESIRIEPVEPTRGVPLMDPSDYRRLEAFVTVVERELNVTTREDRRGLFGRQRARAEERTERRKSTRVEIVSGTAHQVYENGHLIDEREVACTGGAVPVVHIQNLSQPFRYEGLSEVEPLISLQDELNTRLSDRASRVTLQSFQMYLAKGLDGFEKMPVGPGVVWSTDNPDASVEAFAGDGHSPSEESHIEQVRESFDKVSAVPPLASGVVRAKIGNLSSANALKITLMGVLSKTARKRVTYGRGISQISGLVLSALDATGVLKTERIDRGVRIQWADPLPEDSVDEASAAKTKIELGVPRERVLEELGYAATDPGVQ